MVQSSTPPRVIAFAGPPGSGKSTLIEVLAAGMPDACVLALDGFEAPSGMAVGDLAAWLGAGADFSRLTTPGLAEALAALKAGRSVTEPVSARRVRPARTILFEMPLGRAEPSVGALIDVLVWLDTPLDAALARNVIAWTGEARPDAWLTGYMQHYLSVTRRVLEAQNAAVRPGADLVVDGLRTPADQAIEVLAFLERRP